MICVHSFLHTAGGARAKTLLMDSSTLSISTTPGTSLSANVIATSSSRVRSGGSSEQPAAAASNTSISADEVSVKRDVQSALWDQEDEDIYVVLCAVWAGGMLAVAYYAVETGHLYIMPDAAEREDFGLLRRVLLQVQPRVILVSARIDDRMQKVLTDYTHSPVSGGSEKDPVAQVELLPSGDFRVEACKRRLLATPNFPGVKAEGSSEQKLLQLSSILPMDCVNTVRSVGVLLKYIEKKRLGVELEDESVRTPILAVKTFSLENLTVMDESSYSGLQIFQKEYHPSVYKAGKGGTKEGLSLFGIVNRTRSSLGSKLLKLWFLRPLCDLEVLRQRQDVVEFLVAPRNEETTGTLLDCVKHVKNIPRILSRMNAAQVSMSDWQSLYKTAYNGIYIGDICRSLPKNLTIFNKIAEGFTDDLHRVASLITKVVDFEESSIQQRFCVKPHVDEQLDKFKELYNGLPDLLTGVAREELEKLPGVSECNITYLPQLGYLLVIAKSEVEGRDQWLAEMELSLVFEMGDLAHFKCPRMRELDETLGDTQCEIQDHETAIMHRLQEVVLEHSSSLITVVELAAELDCLISLALFAKENNCVRPELTEENVIHIKGGRHPLQEMVVSTFVPNDSCLDLKHGRMKVLTGPNASGKSIYLKQVGIIVFLAHIGSYVPAEAATIGMVDHIFTRIQTRESVSVGLSTFMIDLNQVAAALQGATERSLIILDEFGKGTATVDGVSLLAATLRYWLSQGTQCPNVLVSTHFHSLIQQKLLPSTELVEYLTMETLQEGDELVFLYQLVPGHSDTSYACQVASMVGLPKEVVKRGAEVSDLIRRNEPVTALNTPSLELQRKTCEKIVSRFMELDIENDDLAGFLKDFVLPTAQGIL